MAGKPAVTAAHVDCGTQHYGGAVHTAFHSGLPVMITGGGSPTSYDGHALVEFGVEISEQLDVIPEQLRVIQHQRVKYACPCCDLGIKVTPAPPRIIPRGLLTESALAWIAAGKFQFGMPLYRRAAPVRRFGGDIFVIPIAASMVKAGLATQPVINLMRDALLEAAVVFH